MQIVSNINLQDLHWECMALRRKVNEISSNIDQVTARADDTTNTETYLEELRHSSQATEAQLEEISQKLAGIHDLASSIRGNSLNVTTLQDALLAIRKAFRADDVEPVSAETFAARVHKANAKGLPALRSFVMIGPDALDGSKDIMQRIENLDDKARARLEKLTEKYSSDLQKILQIGPKLGVTPTKPPSKSTSKGSK
jgi:chromosome segregation ATPase